MPKKKAATKKKKVAAKKTATRAGSKKKTVSRKTARSKPAKKKAAPKKASKKVAKKKPAGKKKAASKKKKVAAKKAGTKKKSVAKKRVSAKKPTKKKAVAKKTAAKKPVAKKAVAKKTVAKKAAAKKSATKKKSVPATPSSKKAAARVAVKTTSRVKPLRQTPPVTRTTIKRQPTTLKASTNLLNGPLRGFQPYQPKRGEDYMNDDQLAHFKEILQAWKRELMEEVDRTVLHMKDDAANFPDPNDRATQESEFGLELRTRDRERKLLRKIDSALARIDDGSYGFCEETGDEIGLRRLEARPVATLCVEAQERRELAEKQFRDREDHYR